jgi:hypothetical protein
MVASRAMKRLLVVGVVLAAFGCGKSKQQQAEEKVDQLAKQIDEKMAQQPRKGPAPTGTPRPQSKLAVTLDGKPVTMQQALAWKDASGEVRVTVSSVPVGCDEVTASMRALHGDEITFDVRFAQLLQPDGKLAPTIRSTYYSGMTSQKDIAATATGDGTAGQPTTLDVEFQTTGAAQPTHELTVKGTIDALGCAAPAPSEPAPPLPPEMPATLEVAGKKLPIRGARLSMVGTWPQLELTTGGESCKHVPHEQESELRITLTWFDKAKPEVSQVSLAGTRIKNVMDQTYDKKKITVKPTPPLAGEITLKADIKVMEYPVKLDGKVTAVACPK